MKVFSILLLLEICIFHNTNTFIIPDELPSILSVIYSNIPTIKKGTDSRLGWGFRLGNRADFQVLVELGPQLNTQPLANQNTDTNRNNKRNNVANLANLLYAQREHDKKIITNTDGGKWLEQWSNQINNNEKLINNKAKPGLAIGEIDAKSVIPADVDRQKSEARKLVIRVTSQPDVTATTAIANATEAVSTVTTAATKDEDLSDVEIVD